jgi:type VI secretion system protein ImpA
MAFDANELLAPVSEENPCGEDLFYETEYQMLDRMVAGREESQFAEGEEADWNRVHELATQLLSQGKHIQVVAWLIHAEAELSGWQGLAAGSELLESMLNTYWDGIFPELDAEDDQPALERINVLKYLTDEFGLLRKSLNQLPICNSRRLGQFTWRDILLARGELSQPEDDDSTPPQPDVVAAAVRDTDTEDSEATEQALRSSAAAAGRIDAFLTEKLGTDNTAGMDDLAAHLLKIADSLASMMVGEAPVDEAGGENPADGAAANPGGGNAAAQAKPPGEISGRADVLRAFDKVCAWYEKHEPSSPVPLLVKRARKMVGMTFREIVGEVASDAESQTRNIFGSEQMEPEET